VDLLPLDDSRRGCQRVEEGAGPRDEMKTHYARPQADATAAIVRRLS
jgi:hypothetical protein